jgi:anhydro-N-acetylmuramic acid kinase
MWQQWTLLQENKLIPTPEVYIGCMTGTSADSTADFTAAVFDDQGNPIAYRNCPITLSTKLADSLRHLSTTDRNTTPRRIVCQIESQLTDFLIMAYHDVIAQLGLADYPKEKIILSPHGQAIDHQPNDENFYSDIIVNGPMLSQLSGYKVVTQHRQAPLAVSMAAPLAPVLIKKIFHNPKSDVILLNGGGIANIAVLPKDNPNDIIGFDTGPANGPIDEIVRHIISNTPEIIPAALQKEILQHQFDINGQLANLAKAIPALYQQLLQHPYFAKNYRQKSADRADFSLQQWILPSINRTGLTNYSWLDVITTVEDVIADSIVNAIKEVLSNNSKQAAYQLIHYGGMSHNHYIMARIKKQLQKIAHIEFINMTDLNYQPDFFESLLMAYLGFCANNKIAIDLSYCARNDATKPFAIPGVVAYPG